MIQWFSLVDICDGLRARRCKAGSPLGRIIDECGDCIVISNYSMMVAYALKLDFVGFDWMFVCMNIAFFAMEMKHKMTGKLDMSS